ncbi:MAG: HAD family phosphatase [Erysipelotrichaceae bacterium]|nr:HAD family phosphatase [Erysipelotrichaceae bacterium]
MIQAAFFDVDGTVFDNKRKCVPKSTLCALAQLKQRGVKLFLCTNRSLDEAQALPFELMQLMDGAVLLAGSLLYADEQLIEVPELNQLECRHAIEYMEMNQILYRWVPVTGKGYLCCDDPELISIFERAYGMHPPVKKIEGETISALLYYSVDQSVHAKLEGILKSASHVHLGLANEIIAQGSDKASGMKKMAKHFGIPIEACAAFGDGYNDAVMLKCAGVGIAMGNAKENCLASADYITETIEENGLYNACLHFGWIERDFHEN